MSKRVLLLLIATYIISLLFGLLTPQYREVKALQLDLLKKSTTLNTHVHYVARLNAVLDTLDTKEDLMLRVNQALPSEPNTSALLEFLDVATAQSGVILVDVGGISGALVGDEGGRVIRESKLSLEVSGNYRSFLDLIRTLETLCPLQMRAEEDSMTLS